MHCIYESNEIEMEDMTPKMLKKLIPDFHQLGITEVHLTGGEPLLNPWIAEIIEILSLNGLEVRLQTNGIKINESTIDSLMSKGLKSILISLDGLESNHNFLRNNENSYNAAIHAIKVCVKSGIYTRVNTVLHKKNINDIEGLLKVTKDLGVDQHSFFYLTPGGRGKNIKNLMLSLREWNDIEAKIKSIGKQMGCFDKIKFQNLIIDIKHEVNKCRISARDNCLILADGNVYPCVFFINSPYKLGNIREKSLYDIWNNEDVWNNYNLVRNKRCQNSNCEGGCKGLTYLITGSFQGCDPRCQYKEDLVPGCIRRYVNLK